MIAGYPGASRAVGPVDPPKGELSPWPASNDCASVPRLNPARVKPVMRKPRDDKP